MHSKLQYPEYKKDWYKRNKERILAERREYYEINRDYILGKRAEDRESGIAYIRKWNSRGLYISNDDYDQAFESQEGKCLGCGATQADTRGRRLCADHDHKTGQFRGLLCTSCNLHDVLKEV